MKITNIFVKAAIPLVSITVLLAGIIQLRSQFQLTGAICIVMALLGFILSTRILENHPFTPEDLDRLQPLVIPASIWTIVINLLIVSVTYVVDTIQSAATDRVAVQAWVGSLILSLGYIWWQPTFSFDRAKFRNGIKKHGLELITVIVLVQVALTLRTVGLPVHPYPWSGDELSIGIEARRILAGEVTNYFDTGWSSQSNWSFVPTAITEFLFGENIFAVRLVSAIAGTLAVLFVYLTARELFTPSVALMAGAFLATLPFNVHFSRIGVNNIVDSFMSALVFWLLARALNKNDLRYYFTAGIVGGFCIYSYAGTRLVLILAFAILIYVSIRQRGYFASNWKNLAAFLVAVGISVAPQAAYFSKHRDIFVGRFGQEAIFLNGWLERQTANTGKSILEILFEQFKLTTLVFISSPAPGNFFNSPYPYLTVFGSILFLAGMAFALAHLFETRYSILLGWFWAVILFGGILTMSPPANTRLLMTTPVLCIFMALGAEKFLEYLQRFKLLPGLFKPVIIGAIILIISYQNINFYMIEYRADMFFQDANGEFAMEAGLIAQELGQQYSIYTLGEPRVFSGFPTFEFLVPHNARADLNASNLAALDLQPGQKAVFFAIPENLPLLDEIINKYPAGTRIHFYRKTVPGEILFDYYIVSS